MKYIIIFMMLCLMLLVACTNSQKENNGEYIVHSTDDFTFKLNKDLMFINNEEGLWNIYDTSRDICLESFEMFLTSSMVAGISKIEVEDIEDSLKNALLNIELQGGTVLNVEKIDNNTYLEYIIEFIVPNMYGNRKFFGFIISVEGNLYSMLNLYPSAEEEKGKELLKDILKSIKVNKSNEISSKDTEIKEVLTSNEAMEDLNEMWNVLQINPALYLYRDRESTNKELEKLKEIIESKKEWKRNELYILFAQFVSGIKDGHTLLRASDNFNIDSKKFPLPLIIRNQRAYVSHNMIHPDIIATELKSINTKPMNEVIEAMESLISYDYECEGWKSRGVQENFGLLYSIIYGEVYKYELTYIKDEVEKQLTIYNVDYASKPREERIFNMSVNDNIALLRINRFYSNEIDDINSENELIRNLEFSFGELEEKGVSNLIVDVRNNPGGILNIVEIIHDAIEQWQNQGKTNRDIYLLIDRGSFSAAVPFSAKTKKLDNVLIVGENTGGRRNPIGHSLNYTLRNSKLNMSIATVYFNFSQMIFGNNEHIGPVKPDVFVEIDPIEEAYGKDQIMERVLEIIEERGAKLSAKKL